MTDTARTESQLLALCPDNTSGAISPQDLRDLIASVQIHGPGVYRDQLGDAVASSRGVGAIVTEKYRNTAFELPFMRNNADTWIQAEYQFNHDWCASGSVYPHIHYIPCGTSGTVKFRVTTQWAIHGQAFASAGSATVSTYALTLTAGTKYIDSVYAFNAAAVPTAANVSSKLFVKIERLGASDVADTYQGSKDHGTAQANFGVTYTDTHYIISRAGTETQGGYG